MLPFQWSRLFLTLSYLHFDTLFRYRTLSIHVDDPATNSSQTAADPINDIRQIDAHTMDIDLVFHRYSTHPTLGLESATVVPRSIHGNNIISPPPSQYGLMINES
jgi:sodium/potassium-transporting ATPase subunit alpha